METSTKVPKSYRILDTCLNCGNAGWPMLAEVEMMVCGRLKARPKKHYTNSDHEILSHEYPRLVSYAGWCKQWRKR